MANELRRIPILFLLCDLLGGQSLYSQKKTLTPQEILSLINDRSFVQAKNEIHKNLKYYRNHQLYDSLYKYIQFEGNLVLNNGDRNLALKKAKNLTDEIKNTSESILTSLWKINEVSSTKIIELFYDNLSCGMAKDEALRKAKLKYISTAQGRTAAPHYWAGLILIGETAPVDMDGNSIWWWLLAGAVVLGMLAIFIFDQRRN